MNVHAEAFAQFLREREAASLDYVRGQGDSFMALAATEGDASFFPPGGGHVEGAAAVVNERYAKDVHAFSDKTESSRFEIFHSGADGEIGYWTGLQHAKVQMKGKDEPVAMTLRVTEVFRRQGGGWKIVHRHADMLAEPQKKPGG
jgi:ketosteroid isomerase-like protein